MTEAWSPRRLALLGLLLTVAAAGIWWSWRSGSVRPGQAGREARAAESALAHLQPIGHSRVQGTISFRRRQAGPGVTVAYTIRKLPPGAHGLHILESGSCLDTGDAALAPHLASQGALHGTAESDSSHQGDLGNVFASELGYLTGTLDASRLSLTSGGVGILGRPVIITARPDDGVSQPEGNSGRAIACGVIRPGWDSD